MAKDTNNPFAEYDDNGRPNRSHDTIPARIHGNIQDIPRRTERAALDLAAYGEMTGQSPDEAVEELIKTGRWERCSKCGVAYPATVEYFRAHSGKRRGYTQPCKRCNAELSRRGMAEGRARGMWRKASKLRRHE